jgi:uncharacterized repeat protein (TIGR01451 family)
MEVTYDRKEGAARGRRVVLALVLGLLGALLVIMTANAYVAKKTHDTLLDFDRGRFFYTGLLDIPPDIHSVQLLPVGLTGEWDPNGQKLPHPLADMGATTNGDVIYVAGGTTPGGSLHVVDDRVYTSIMTGVKGMLTPWFQEPSLPEARTGAAAAVHRGAGGISTLYVVGGLAPGQWPPTDTVYRAQIDNNTGHIVGDWTTDSQKVPKPLYYAEAVVRGNYLYIIGGNDGAESFDTVYYAAINPADGSLGAFATTSPLPGPKGYGLFDGYAVVFHGEVTDTLYYIGGMYINPTPGEPNRLATEEVYFADFESTGELSAWTRSDGALPRPLYAHSGVLIRQGEILSTGGIADPLDPFETFTSTVQSALVDPDNPSFRLFNWCDTVPDPASCTIGAWLTGKLMPDVRALHGAVTGHGYVYVLGGMDGERNIRDTVFFGTVNGAGAAYAPEGVYLSEEIDLEQPATLVQLDWQTTISDTDEMTMTMQYQTYDGQMWSGWSPKVVSQHGLNSLEPVSPTTDIRLFQYRVSFTTVLTYASPRLDRVDIYYEVPDPDVTVMKSTGVTTAQLSSPLEYTIFYTNTGGWVAENVVLTETLSEHTIYAGGPEWHQVDTLVYTRSVGDLERGASDSTTFLVNVKERDEIPIEVLTITNRVDIDYPPMVDELGNIIRDRPPDDNWHILETPLAVSALTITKSAEPASGTQVTPGSYITYTLRYTNIGNLTVSDAVLTDTFDLRGSYTVKDASPEPDQGNNVWYLGTLAPTKEEGGEITIKVQLNERLPNNWLVTNEASLSNPEGAPYQGVVTHTMMNYVPGTDPPEPKPMVDLEVIKVWWEPPSPVAGEWPTFYATVTNTGDADAMDPFWVELYIKPSPSEPPSGPKDHDRGLCLDDCLPGNGNYRRRYVEQISSLAAKDSEVVTFENLYQDKTPDFPEEGTYDIYVQVDVSFDGPDYNPYWGLYPEDREDNNLGQPKELQIEKGKVYLPLIYRRAP